MQKLLLALGLLANNTPQLPRLDKISVRDAGRKRRYIAGPRLVRRDAHALGVRHGFELREDVVRVPAVVAVHGAGPVTHVRRVDGVVRPVWWQLEVIGPDAVAVGVGVREHSCLED